MSEDFERSNVHCQTSLALSRCFAGRLPTVPTLSLHNVSGEWQWQSMQLEGLLDPVDYFAEIHAAMARCGARYVIGYAADYFLQSSAQKSS